MKTPKLLHNGILLLIGIVILPSFVPVSANKSTNQKPVEPGIYRNSISLSGNDRKNELNLDPSNQTEEAIVTKIRQMYQEVLNLGMKNCPTKKKKEYVSPNLSDPSIPKMETTQTVKICQLDKAYEVVSGRLTGWEWAEDFFIYKKNGKVFFILINGASEGMEYERRFYCDGNETVVRHLDKESDDGNLAKTQSVKVPLPAGNRNVYRICSDIFNGINNVLSGTR